MCLCYVLSRECLYDLSNTLTYITVCSTSLMYSVVWIWFDRAAVITHCCQLRVLKLSLLTLLCAWLTIVLYTTGGQQCLHMLHCTGVCYIPPISLQKHCFNWYVNLMVSKLNVLVFWFRKLGGIKVEMITCTGYQQIIKGVATVIIHLIYSANVI